MFGFVREKNIWIYQKMFIELLRVYAIGRFPASSASNSGEYLKCISLNNQACQARPTLVNINFDETLFYPFSNSVNKCGRSCNTIDVPYGWGCVRIKVSI